MRHPFHIRNDNRGNDQSLNPKAEDSQDQLQMRLTIPGPALLIFCGGV